MMSEIKDRRERLAEQLRANLKKRKTQAKARQTGGKDARVMRTKQDYNQPSRVSSNRNAIVSD